MTSAETKVIVLALLVLGVGLFYTNINQKGSITSGAVTTDKDIFIEEQQTYDREVSYVQPQQQVPQGDAQQQFIGLQVTELKQKGENAETVCSELKKKDNPFASLYNECLRTMSEEFAKV